MSTFYFFTEIDLLSAQSADHAYGPLSDSGTLDQYRVSNHFTATGDPTAFAICRGKLCVQLVAGQADLVNVILKPLQRPSIPMVSVAYILYKGIQKSSILSGSEVAKNDLELTTALHTYQERRNIIFDAEQGNDPGTTTTPAPSEAVGIQLTGAGYADTDPIDHLFYRSSGTFELPLVDGGESIGKFQSAKVGIEIILDMMGGGVPLAPARSLEHVLSVSKLAGAPSQAKTMNHWRQKEELLRYMDAAAFFGSFYASGLRVKTSGGEWEERSGNALYTDVLRPFRNKNTVYFDIRNHFGQSFDSMENYGRSVDIAYSETGGLVTRNYYDELWPILRILKSNWPVSTFGTKNIVRLAFPLGDNSSPRLVIRQGYRNRGGANDPFPSPPRGRERFFELTVSAGATRTHPVDFAIPNIEDQSSTTPVASYVQLEYALGHDRYRNPRGSKGRVLRSNNALDNLFPIFDLVGDSALADDVSIFNRTYGSSQYIDDPARLAADGQFDLGVAADSEQVVMYAYRVESNHDDLPEPAFPSPAIPTGHYPTNPAELTENILAFEEGIRLRKSELKKEGDSLEYLTLERAETSVSNLRRTDFEEDFLALLISRTEYEQLEALRDASNLTAEQPILLGTDYVGREKDDNGIQHEVFELVLSGYEHDAATDENIAKDVSTGIFVRSGRVRSKVFASNAGVQGSSAPINGNPDLNKEPYLRSKLFAGDMVLQRVLEGRVAVGLQDSSGNRAYGEFVKRIQLAVKIVLPEMASTEASSRQLFLDLRDSDSGLKVDRDFGNLTREWVRRFQQEAGLADQDGIVGSETVARLDEELQKIYYYNIDSEKEKALHNKSKAAHVGRFTVVSNGIITKDDLSENLTGVSDEQAAKALRLALIDVGYLDENYVIKDTFQIGMTSLPELAQKYPQFAGLQAGIIDLFEKKNGANLRSEPSTVGGEILRWLPYNSRIRLIEVVDNWGQKDWCYVEAEPASLAEGAEKKVRGYVFTDLLWTNSEMPEPNAQLFTFRDGEGLLETAGRFYDTTSQSGLSLDLRFFANVLLYVNNPEGTEKKKQFWLNFDTGRFSLEEQVDAAVYLKTESWYDFLLSPNIKDSNFLGILEPLPLNEMTWDQWQDHLKENGAGTHWDDWEDTVTLADWKIWVPSKSFAQSLAHTVNVGSLAGQWTVFLQKLEQEIQSLWDTFEHIIDMLWPEGWGFEVDAGLGATFGIPVGVDVEYHFYLWRASRTSFRMIRRGVVGGGLDAGVGVGAFIGIGKKTSWAKKPGADDQYGLGGEAGAQIKAGLRLIVNQEYEFPITEDWGLVNLLYTALNLDGFGSIADNLVQTGGYVFGGANQQSKTMRLGSMSRMSLGHSFLSLFKPSNLDPNDYLTSFKIEFGGYIQGAASVWGGLRIGEQSAIDYWSNKRDTRDDNIKSESLKARMIFGLLKVSLGVSASFEMGTGLELEYSGYHLDETTGLRIPDRVDAYIYSEAQAAANIAAKFPSFPTWALSTRSGAGIKFFFSFNVKNEEFEQVNSPRSFPGKFGLKTFSIYSQDGKFDIYEGSAHETAFSFDPQTLSQLNPFASRDEFRQLLKEELLEVTFKRRMNLGFILDLQNTKYRQFTLLRERLPSMIRPNGEPSFGALVDGYFTFEASIDGKLIIGLFETLLKHIQENKASTSEEILSHLHDYFTTGEAAQEIPKTVHEILDNGALKSADLVVLAGGGIGLGAKLGLALKGRFQVNAAFRIMWFDDVKAELVSLFKEGDWENHLKLLLEYFHQPGDRYYQDPTGEDGALD